MPAGQAHSVVSPTRTVTVGGHFLCEEMLEKTLQTQLLEAAVGQRSTNAEHPTVLLAIQDIMEKTLEQARSQGELSPCIRLDV